MSLSNRPIGDVLAESLHLFSFDLVGAVASYLVYNRPASGAKPTLAFAGKFTDLHAKQTCGVVAFNETLGELWCALTLWGKSDEMNVINIVSLQGGAEDGKVCVCCVSNTDSLALQIVTTRTNYPNKSLLHCTPYDLAFHPSGKGFMPMRHHTDVITQFSDHIMVLVWGAQQARFCRIFFQHEREQSTNFPNHYGVAVNHKTGLLYITLEHQACVAVFATNATADSKAKSEEGEVGDDNGTCLRKFAHPDLEDNQFCPHAIAINQANGDMYISDCLQQRIYVCPSFPCLSSLLCVQVFSAEDEFDFEFGEEGSENGQFKEPCSLAFDRGMLYVLDRGNSRVQVFQSNGDFVTSFSIEPRVIALTNPPASKGTSSDREPKENKLTNICIDSEGRLIVGFDYGLAAFTF